MNYAVTKRYLRSNERFIASFDLYDDACLFIQEKISEDEQSKKSRAYRLYDDAHLIHEFGGESFSSVDEEDSETFLNSSLPISVMVQPETSLERFILAYFGYESDARLFIESKCTSTVKKDNGNTFMIYREQILIATLNKAVIVNEQNRKKIEKEGADNGFNPSPLKTRYAPPGGPPDCWDSPPEED